MKLSEQDKKELKFLLKATKEVVLALTIALTLTFLIIAIWKIY